jgi:chromosome segregation ATPase
MDPEYRKQKINDCHQEIKNAEDKIKSAQHTIDSMNSIIEKIKEKIEMYEKNNYWVEIKYPEFNLMYPQYTRECYYWFATKEEVNKFLSTTMKSSDIKSFRIQNKPFFE